MYFFDPPCIIIIRLLLNSDEPIAAADVAVNTSLIGRLKSAWWCSHSSADVYSQHV